MLHRPQLAFDLDITSQPLSQRRGESECRFPRWIEPVDLHVYVFNLNLRGLFDGAIKKIHPAVFQSYLGYQETNRRMPSIRRGHSQFRNHTEFFFTEPQGGKVQKAFFIRDDLEFRIFKSERVDDNFAEQQF